MLKRSFAEFYAQRSAPKDLEAMRLGEIKLGQYKCAPWPACTLGCSKAEVRCGRACMPSVFTRQAYACMPCAFTRQAYDVAGLHALCFDKAGLRCGRLACLV
jgi:hypothetical protein